MKMEEALRELREERRSLGASPELETALLAEFRRAHRRRRAWVWLAPAAATAIASAAIAVAMFRPAAVDPPAPVLAKIAPAPIEMTPPRPVVAEAAPVRRARPKPTPREVYTAFQPVPGGDPFEPFDRGQLVRVRLPRTAMNYFGLPVNPARGEFVKADVVLGEDGMARAIRFVQDRY